MANANSISNYRVRRANVMKSFDKLSELVMNLFLLDLQLDEIMLYMCTKHAFCNFLLCSDSFRQPSFSHYFQAVSLTLCAMYRHLNLSSHPLQSWFVSVLLKCSEKQCIHAEVYSTFSDSLQCTQCFQSVSQFSDSAHLFSFVHLLSVSFPFFRQCALVLFRTLDLLPSFIKMSRRNTYSCISYSFQFFQNNIVLVSCGKTSRSLQ